MRIRVVRESGGLGDMVRMAPVLDGLRVKYPGAEIDFYGLPDYRELLVGHTPSLDRYIVCPRDRRRPRDAPLDEKRFPYLAKGIQYDLEIDEFCPAWAHEAETRGSVTRERVELFCSAAGVPPGPVVFHLTAEERAFAQVWARELCGAPDPARLVAVQPYATHCARAWAPQPRWPGQPLPSHPSHPSHLSPPSPPSVANWTELLNLLIAADFYPVIFDAASARIAPLPGRHETNVAPWGHLAAMLSVCQALVGVDSGLFHLAGAVGTPCLLIAAATNGEILCRPYPRARWIAGSLKSEISNSSVPSHSSHLAVAPSPLSPPSHLSHLSPPSGCAPPCYAFAERGYAPQCRDWGCAVAQSLSPQAVFDAFLRLPIASGGPSNPSPPSHLVVASEESCCCAP